MTRLADLGASELLDYVQHQSVGEHDALQILRNPYCTAEVALLIAEGHRRAMASHKVRELVSGFRGMPLTRAMNLIATLPWMSLLLVAKEPRTPPAVRRYAEQKILQRLSTMSLGEKVALARISHRPLFRALIDIRDQEVLIALLDNARLVENDILVIVNTVDVPTAFIREVAAHRRWGQYLGVRKALVACANTPLPTALSLMVQLNANDLRSIVERPKLRNRVRQAASALLEKTNRRSRRMIRSSVDECDGSTPDPPENPG